MSTEESSRTLDVHRIPLYNPSRLKDAEIIAAFAARKSLLERIVADLSDEKPGSRAQHHLVIGQRGMGKTLLLARIAAELRTSVLSTRFIPLVFAEEQYSIDRLSKFWLNCLDSLADEQDRAGAKAVVQQIDDTVQQLTYQHSREKGDEALAREAYEAFMNAASATGRRPVLLVDNLQIVFERLTQAEAHSLREIMMRADCPILIGASPNPLAESHDYGAAFYDFFKVYYLRPLNTDEMKAVMLHLADAAKRDDVRQRVVDHPERLAVLHQLIGGNPRTTVTLFFLYAEDFAPSVFSDLESLLDRVTPLYKAVFEELSTQQQVVASAIANHWDPITSQILAESTGLAPNQISPQLDRLTKTGFIEKVELFQNASTGYQIAERFFNVWFLMRSSSRRQRREVEFLTRFIESVYEANDRERLAKHLMNEHNFSSDRYLLSRALAGSLPNNPTAEDLKRHADLDVLRQQDRSARRRLAEILDLSDLPPATLAFDQIRRNLCRLVSTGSAISPEQFADAILGDREMLRDGQRERLASRSEILSVEDIDETMKVITSSRDQDKRAYSEDAVTWFSNRLISGQLRSVQDVEDWNRAFQATTGRESTRIMVDTLPEGVGEKLPEETVKQIYNQLTPAKDAAAWGWLAWGMLQEKLQRYEEAESTYHTVIDRDSKNASAWVCLGILLEDHLYKHKEAEDAYRKAVVCDSTESFAWSRLGLLLCSLHRYEEAEDAYLTAITHNPKGSFAQYYLGIMLYELQRYDEAKGLLTEAIDSSSMAVYAYHPLICLCRDYTGEVQSARQILNDLTQMVRSRIKYPDRLLLHQSLFSAYEENWGVTKDLLAKALDAVQDHLVQGALDDWMRSSAVLLHLNYGTELLEFLQSRGDRSRLRPWYEAISALQRGDRRYLRNIAPEIRATAESFYDQISHYLDTLPAATRRRPLPEKPKATRAKRGKSKA